MRPFGYVRADTARAAVEAASAGGTYIAGGTNLLDLVKYDVERPSKVVDIGRLPMRGIEDLPDGGLRLHALGTNADTAYAPAVQSRYPVLSSAILAGASPQLRNMATNGGNLNQRTRCYYFYSTATPCNKREPGSGCSAIGGINRIHAILGATEQCIASFPSDMCTALRVLDARVQVTGLAGERTIPIADYHRLPGDEPWRDNTLGRGELITAVDLPRAEFGQHYTYLKLRDRLSYAFALVSVAVLLRIEDGRIAEARVALGSVAAKPWRRPDVEASLVGESPTATAFARFAGALIEGARGYGGNDYKLRLVPRAIVRACLQAAAGTPQSQFDKRIA